MTLLVKQFSWWAAVVLLALAFPLQVLFNNPNMAALAYIPVFLIYALSAMRRDRRREWRELSRLTSLDRGVLLYSALIGGHILFSLLIHEIAVPETFRQVFLFLVPVTFYVYVSRFADERELKPMLFGIVVAALIVGVYFAYDSFEKIIWMRTGAYQLRAQAYSAARMGLRADQMNPFRTNAGSRSMGLLEKHTASGAWIGFGAFASLFLLGAKPKVLRAVVSLGWLSLLVAGLNITSLLGFLFVTLIVYVWPSVRSLLKIRRIDRRQAAICIGGFVVAVASAVVLWSAGPGRLLLYVGIDVCGRLLLYVGIDVWRLGLVRRLIQLPRFCDYIEAMIASQLSKVTTVRAIGGDKYTSWLAWTWVELRSYFHAVERHPFALFFGNGPVMGTDFLRGGDTGFVETLGFFGLPVFLLIVVGLLKACRAVLKELKAGAGERRGPLEFGLAVVLFVAVFEAHYSVWAYKSVSPILFIALGLLRRYRRSLT